MTISVESNQISKPNRLTRYTLPPRKNRDAQLKRTKQTHSAAEKRGLGGAGHAPICVVLLPAYTGVDITQCAQMIRAQGEAQDVGNNSFYLVSNKLKKR